MWRHESKWAHNTVPSFIYWYIFQTEILSYFILFIDDDQRTAWSILTDYLEFEISALLAKHLNIKEEPVKKVEAASKPITLTGSRTLPTGPKEGARPLEDYSEAELPKAKQAKLSGTTSSKQKALAKSATGSKNIMSFFGKKWTNFFAKKWHIYPKIARF